MKMTKRFLGILLSLVMVLGLLPGMGFTAYADVPQEGSNKYVGYRHNNAGFLVYGKREKADGTIEEIQTTFYNGGYTTVMEVVGSGSIQFGDFAYGKEYILNDVKANVTARVRGKGVLVTYTLFNDSDEPKTVKIGSYADTQIYNDDKAPCSFTENGIKMTSVDGTLEFQLIPGGGNFTTRWYGRYPQARDNVFENRTDPSTFTDDSEIAWSWTIDIPARATITKTAELSAGQVGTKQIIYDANGGTGEMDPTVDIPGESIKLNKNTFTKNNCVFQGWDTNSAGTTVVYADEATLTMPDTDTTLYAVWKANAVPATVTANNRTYDGAEKSLVTVDDSTLDGGMMQYALGSDATTEPTEGWSTSIPTATNVGTYYVWYKAKGDSSHADSDAGYVIAEIKKSEGGGTPSEKTPVYDGTAQELVTEGKAEGGTMMYALGTDEITAPDATAYTTSIPAGINAGTYYVWYMVKGDANHNDFISDTPVKVEIAPAGVTLTANSGTGTYTGEEQAVTGFTASVAGLTFAETVNASGRGTNAGEYPVTFTGVTIGETKDTTGNYVAKETINGNLIISKAAASVTSAPQANNLTCNDAAQSLVAAGEGTGGIVQYALGTDATTAPTSGWSTSVPTGIEAGTYYVWYKVVGDENHGDSVPACITVEIAKAPEPSPKPAPAPAPSGGGGGYYGGGAVQNQRRDAYSDVIGAASASYWGSSAERIHNIELACEKLDGIVLQPGEVFSFNEAVGLRTAEAGFEVAPVDANDEATAEMGGGVSQVSSTLYASALLGLLEPVERTNHSFPVSFIQPGTDALVTNPDDGDNAADLKFRNTRTEPIRISATCRVDEATQLREVLIEIRSALTASDYMPILFDNSWSGNRNGSIPVGAIDYTRPGYRILLTHEEQAFTDASGAGIRTLTHRKILDAAGMLVRDEILNSKLPDGSYAMDTYYQG